MNSTFKKFCKEINFSIPEYLNESTISNVENKKENFAIDLNFFSIPHANDLKNFFDSLKNFPFNVELNIKYLNENLNKDSLLDLIIFSSKHFSKMDFSVLFKSCEIKWNDFAETLNISVFLDAKLKRINDVKTLILENLSKIGLNKININVSKKIITNQSDISVDKVSLTSRQKELLKSNSNATPSIKRNSYYNGKKDYEIMDMNDFLFTEKPFVEVQGQVFFVEQRKTSTDLIILTIQLTDFEDAVNAKMFIKNPETKAREMNIKVGDFVSIKGERKTDIYNGLFLNIHSIEPKQKMDNFVADNEKDKRIEFSLRTSMSAMDGFISSSEFMDYYEKQGYKSIVFTDFQNIQAYPEIFNKAKRMNIKPIYGINFSSYDRNHHIVINNSNEMLKDVSYTVFDIETTGLSPRVHDIIEFGAVKVKNGVVEEEFQIFAKTSKPISEFTTKLTNITNEMLEKDGVSEEEALKRFLKFSENSVLVAHNAKFDHSFICEKAKKYNIDLKIKNVVDTLQLSRFLIKKSKSYRLEVICKKLFVDYDASIAHRADYDADVLSKVWVRMIEMLKNEYSIDTFDGLYNIESRDIYEKNRPNDVTYIVKNQVGLKKLFKLVTKTHTENYYKNPILFTDEIKHDNDLLIGVNSINSRVMEKMLYGTTEDLIDEIKRLDFIGIPAIHLFSHIYSTKTSFSKDEIKTLLKDLVIRSKKMGKIVIAVGDVRFYNDFQFNAHKIYISAKGLEGMRHPFYNRDKNIEISKQIFLTTSEMKKSFSWLESNDLVEEIVVKNTNILNDLIDEKIEVIKNKLYPPNFDNSDVNLSDMVWRNAKLKYGENIPEIVSNRIKRELEPIIKYGFSIVYWISSKLVIKSNDDGYVVGSRGSVGSSLVATLSNITEVNPLSPHYICGKCKYSEFSSDIEIKSGYDLPDKDCPNCSTNLSKEGQTIPFETFLGFEGDKVPDIDLNFSGIYQSTIHKYVKDLFGDKHSFRAGTISTVAAKTAFGYSKSWLEEMNLEKSDAYTSFLSQIVQGSKRTTGQHPGGIIIIPKEYDVEDFTPVNYPANDIESSWKTTHFDFHAIHDSLLKLDLLGHDDPTVLRLLQLKTGVNVKEISFSDKKVMSLFINPEALGITSKEINDEPTGAIGIPEFGTRFVRRMLLKAKPKSFSDLVSISGLSHGTDVWNGNAEKLIDAGKTINDVISCRDDIMVYLINKGIDPKLSFKIMEMVRKGQGVLPEDAENLTKNGIEDWYIDSMNKIKYMFPKAHATAYVMMAWRIAWFKIYYPLAYYATYFTVRLDIFDIETAILSKDEIIKKMKLNEAKAKDKSQKSSTKDESLIPIYELLIEMKARGLEIEKPNIYKSDAHEWIVDNEKNVLIPPLTSIDGLGLAAAESVICEREKKPFSSQVDLMKRTLVNKTTISKMKENGFLNDIDETDQMQLF